MIRRPSCLSSFRTYLVRRASVIFRKSRPPTRVCYCVFFSWTGGAPPSPFEGQCSKGGGTFPPPSDGRRGVDLLATNRTRGRWSCAVALVLKGARHAGHTPFVATTWRGDSLSGHQIAATCYLVAATCSTQDGRTTLGIATDGKTARC